ncbi:hypothetical protein B0H12DRAFT_1234007 [Mycena haematopus]|nr:hypothetical protein B0H12DRAFT_1234007 [Mycena haematopus]
MPSYSSSVTACPAVDRSRTLPSAPTVVRRPKDPLAYLEHPPTHLSVARADVDVQPYAFTTNSLFIGRLTQFSSCATAAVLCISTVPFVFSSGDRNCETARPPSAHKCRATPTRAPWTLERAPRAPRRQQGRGRDHPRHQLRPRRRDDSRRGRGAQEDDKNDPQRHVLARDIELAEGSARVYNLDLKRASSVVRCGICADKLMSGLWMADFIKPISQRRSKRECIELARFLTKVGLVPSRIVVPSGKRKHDNMDGGWRRRGRGGVDTDIDGEEDGGTSKRIPGRSRSGSRATRGKQTGQSSSEHARTDRPLVTEDQLKACAGLFSSHYGVWSSFVSPPLKPRAHVKMSAAKLRDQCFSDPEHSMLALCTADNAIVGHAFATVWQYNGSGICWITQLVVSRDYRERGIATGLLQLFPGPDFNCGTFGLVSSHPAACLALFKRAHAKSRKLDLDFIKAHAQKIMDTTNISYLKGVQLRGSLLQEAEAGGAMSCAFTDFYVDHEEPLRAMNRWEEKQDMAWPLGVLPEGHEFFCIAPNSR